MYFCDRYLIFPFQFLILYYRIKVVSVLLSNVKLISETIAKESMFKAFGTEYL